MIIECGKYRRLSWKKIAYSLGGIATLNAFWRIDFC